MTSYLTSIIRKMMFNNESDSESESESESSMNEDINKKNKYDDDSSNDDSSVDMDVEINDLGSKLRKQHLKKEPTIKQKDCYEVEKLIDMRKIGNTTQYLVKWAVDQYGNTYDDNWENEENINSDLIRDYHFTNQINNHNSQVGATHNNAHLYLRVSDKAKTNRVMNRYQNTQSHQTIQSAQSYFTNFPEGNFSLDSQKEILFKYCIEHNYNIKSIKYDDGISARDVSKLNGLQELISEIKTGETLLFIDLSRFSRDSIGGIKILEDLNARGVRIYSVLDGMNYDTPSSRHCVRSAISGAQLESDLKSLKIRTSIQNIKSKGGFVGSQAPFGQKIIQEGHLRKLVSNSNEKQIIKMIGNMLANYKKNDTIKKMSTEIAKHLNSNKLTYRGKSFTSDNVNYIIKKYVSVEDLKHTTGNNRVRYIRYTKQVALSHNKRNAAFMANREN
jgi:DNA invertase Pin-like site-specific DNA recombinase